MQPTNKKQKYLYNQDISQFLMTDSDKSVPIGNEQTRETRNFLPTNRKNSVYSKKEEERFVEYKLSSPKHDNLLTNNDPKEKKENENLFESPVWKLRTSKKVDLDINITYNLFNFPVSIEFPYESRRFSKLISDSKSTGPKSKGLEQKIFLANPISQNLKPRLKIALSRTPVYSIGDKNCVSPISVGRKNWEGSPRISKIEKSLLQNEIQGFNLGIEPKSRANGKLNLMNDQHVYNTFGKKINLQLPCIPANSNKEIKKNTKKIYLFKGKK